MPYIRQCCRIQGKREISIGVITQARALSLWLSREFNSMVLFHRPHHSLRFVLVGLARLLGFARSPARSDNEQSA